MFIFCEVFSDEFHVILQLPGEDCPVFGHEVVLEGDFIGGALGERWFGLQGRDLLFDENGERGRVGREVVLGGLEEGFRGGGG